MGLGSRGRDAEAWFGTSRLSVLALGLRGRIARSWPAANGGSPRLGLVEVGKHLDLRTVSGRVPGCSHSQGDWVGAKGDTRLIGLPWQRISLRVRGSLWNARRTGSLPPTPKNRIRDPIRHRKRYRHPLLHACGVPKRTDKNV